jgi:hypothetical protein
METQYPFEDKNDIFTFSTMLKFMEQKIFKVLVFFQCGKYGIHHEL